jgi:hypothetical protein
VVLFVPSYLVVQLNVFARALEPQSFAVDGAQAVLEAPDELVSAVDLVLELLVRLPTAVGGDLGGHHLLDGIVSHGVAVLRQQLDLRHLDPTAAHLAAAVLFLGGLLGLREVKRRGKKRGGRRFEKKRGVRDNESSHTQRPNLTFIAFSLSQVFFPSKYFLLSYLITLDDFSLLRPDLEDGSELAAGAPSASRVFSRVKSLLSMRTR